MLLTGPTSNVREINKNNASAINPKDSLLVFHFCKIFFHFCEFPPAESSIVETDYFLYRLYALARSVSLVNGLNRFSSPFHTPKELLDEELSRKPSKEARSISRGRLRRSCLICAFIEMLGTVVSYDALARHFSAAAKRSCWRTKVSQTNLVETPVA